MVIKQKKSAVPEYIWAISLIIIALTLIVSIKTMMSGAEKMYKKIKIADLKAELQFKIDDLDSLWLEVLKFKIPKDVDKEMFFQNLNLVCYDGDKQLIIPIMDFSKNFLAQDKLNYYTLTKRVFLAGVDKSTLFYFSYNDCNYSKNFTKDLSGNNNKGFYSSTNIGCEKGIKGNSVKLNNQHIEIKKLDFYNNNSLTFCSWIKLNDFSNENVFISIVDSSNNKIFHFSSKCSNSPHKCLYGLVNTNQGNKNIEVSNILNNDWNFVCFVFDGEKGKLSLWLNGELKVSNNIGQSFINKKPNKVYLAQINGLIDESFLFNRGLKDYEIKTLYFTNCWKKGAQWSLFVGTPEEDGILVKTVFVN